MKIIQKYSFVIIVVLAFLLACKSCQSCSRSRTIAFNETKHELVVDSLKAENLKLNDSIMVLNERLRGAQELNRATQQHIQDINQTNEQLSKSNNNLINHIKSQDGGY